MHAHLSPHVFEIWQRLNSRILVAKARRPLQIKRGVISDSPFAVESNFFELERVSPVEEHIQPVAAFAGATVAVVDIPGAANPKVMRGLVAPVAQVRGVVPE